jgi:hypothetical protein
VRFRGPRLDARAQWFQVEPLGTQPEAPVVKREDLCRKRLGKSQSGRLRRVSGGTLDLGLGTWDLGPETAAERPPCVAVRPLR